MRAHSPLRCGVSGAVPGGVLTLISMALLYLCLLLYGISDGSLLSRRGTDLAFDLSLCSEVGTSVCTGEGGQEKRLVFAPRFRPLGVDDLVTDTKTDAPAVVHYSAKGFIATSFPCCQRKPCPREDTKKDAQAPPHQAGNKVGSFDRTRPVPNWSAVVAMLVSALRQLLCHMPPVHL